MTILKNITSYMNMNEIKLNLKNIKNINIENNQNINLITSSETSYRSKCRWIASCLTAILKKSVLSIYYPVSYDTTNSSLSLYCEKYPSNFQCTEDNYLSYLYIKNGGLGGTFVASDFECFQQNGLIVKLENFLIDENVYYSSKYNQFQFYYITCGISTIKKNIPSMRSLFITTNGFGYLSNINLSWIKDITYFSLNGGGSFTMYYVNDLVAPSNDTSYSLTSLSVTTKGFPNIINTNIKELKLNLIGLFDASTANNLGTSNSLETITIVGDSWTRIDFPKSILSLTNLKSLSTTNLYFWTPPSQIDFSEMPSLKSLYFDNSVGFTTSNILSTTQKYGIPSTLESFTMIDSTISSAYPFYGLFSKTPQLYFSNSGLPDNLDIVLQLADSKYLTDFDLSNNKLTGTINEKWCKIKNLNLYSNPLKGGALPSCFYCHFNNNQALIDKVTGPITNKNQYTNFNYLREISSYSYPSCTSLLPDLRFENNRTYLYGTSLGFDTSYFTTTPNANWKIDVPSYSFYKDGVDIEMFNVNFIYAKLKFTLSALKIPPVIDSVYISSSGQLTFNGSYFSYDITSTNVTIISKSIGCTVQFSNFTTMICQLNVPISQVQTLVDENVSIYVGIQNRILPITFLPDFTNRYLNCTEDCTGKGYCDRNSGTCICNCHGHGSCDIRNRKCICATFWIGSDCDVPDHYVSSVIPSNIKGGNVTLNGWYGPEHKNLSVQIGNPITGYLNCSVLEFNTNVIVCLIGAGTGRQNVIVTQNNHSWTGVGIYLYNQTLAKCPNDCTNSTVGICDERFGICNCYANYTGIDCSTRIIYQPPQTNTSIDQGSGTANITNQDTKYILKITKLAEITINGSVVLQHELDPKKWNVTIIKSNNTSGSDNNTTDSNTKYIFIQNVAKNTTVTYTIEEISGGDKNFSFAGVDFLVTNGSLKLTIDVENYVYQSSLNTLQVQISTSVESLSKCLVEKAKINNIDQESTLNYITISKDGNTLTGRFINRALSDGKATYITSNIVSLDETSITVGLNLPHCYSCVLDPDFSVLVNSVQKSSDSCEDASNEQRKWFLPVVIVLPTVGATAILIVSIVIFSKYKTALRIKLNSFMDPSIKMNNLDS